MHRRYLSNAWAIWKLLLQPLPIAIASFVQFKSCDHRRFRQRGDLQNTIQFAGNRVEVIAGAEVPRNSPEQVTVIVPQKLPDAMPCW